jgi:hypothetical protein
MGSVARATQPIQDSRRRPPTGLQQRSADLIDYRLWVISDCPGWEAQHPIPTDPHLVLSLHIGPPASNIHMLAAVDLDMDMPVREVGVSISPPTTRVDDHSLARWSWEISVAAESEKLKFRYRL